MRSLTPCAASILLVIFASSCARRPDNRGAQTTRPAEKSPVAPALPSAPPSPQPAIEPTPTQPAPLAAAAITPADLALKWIDAVRAHDAKAIAAITMYPFTFRDTDSTVACQGLSAIAADESQLATALRCPLEDDLLDASLKAHPGLMAVETPVPKLPRWTKRYKKDIAPGDKPVVIDISDNGVFFQFVVLIADDRVHTVLRTAVFDPN